MKLTQMLFALLATAGFGACTEDSLVDNNNSRHIVITAEILEYNTTRAYLTQKDGSLDMIARINESDEVSLLVEQDGVFYQNRSNSFSGSYPLTSVSENQKSCTFEFDLREEIDPNRPYTVYGGLGMQTIVVDLDDDGKKAGLIYGALNRSSGLEGIPLYFQMHSGTPTDRVKFKHIAAYEIVHVTNISNKAISFNYGGFMPDEPWYYLQYHILFPDGTIWGNNNVQWSGYISVETINSGDTKDFMTCYLPTGQKMTNAKLRAIVNGTEITSSNTKSSDAEIKAGNAYHMYATWDGKELKFTDGSDDLRNPENSKIIMTTAKTPGEQLEFGYFYGKNIWFDMNNNGVRELDEYPEGGSDHITFRPTVQSQTFTIYGNITGSFDCGSDNFEHGYNRLTSIDMSEFYGEMEQIFCAYNELTQLILPKSTLLNWVWCSDNQLTELDASELPSLKALYANNNILTSVKLPRTVNLEKVDIQRNYSLTSLDVRGLTCLNELRCQNCRIDMLDVSQNPELLLLLCDGNRLTSLDLSANQKLLALGCNYNSLDKQALETIYSQLPDVTHEIENIENIINDPQLFRMLRADHNPGYDEADQTIATRKGWEFEDKWIASSRQRGSSGEGGQR